jgi:tetratricopeptide (TPR) repeat protein
MSTSRDIHESLNKLKVLGGLNDIRPNLRKEKIETIEDTMNRQLGEYKDALEYFKSTNQARAEEHYANLKRQNPAIGTYDQILEKLRKICDLPQMLGLYMQNHTDDQANDIYKHCRSILYMHNATHYNPLFMTSKYFNNFGQEIQPEYGTWTYNGHKYEMKKMITEIQEIMSYFITTLSS